MTSFDFSSVSQQEHYKSASLKTKLSPFKADLFCHQCMNVSMNGWMVMCLCSSKLGLLFEK